MRCYLLVLLLLAVYFQHQFQLQAQTPHRALILIDIQNDYFEGGRVPLINPQQASDQARQILERFRSEKRPVIHIRHLSTNPKSKSFNGQSFGSEIHVSVAPKADSSEKVIIKHFPNSFQETELRAYLQSLKVTEVVVVGMMTHMCVEATVRAAKDFGFRCIVIGDACATRELTLNGETLPAETIHRATLATLNGYYATVMMTADYLSAKTP